jgi:hypothetical protein
MVTPTRELGKSPSWTGGTVSAEAGKVVNRKVDGSSPCPGANF